MRAKSRQLAINLALVAGSVLVGLLFLEFVVFGLILRPDDVLPNVSVNGVVRYMPNSHAVFRHPDGTQSLVTINRQGWNSTKPAYSKAKTPGVLRIAVVGDSYVHGSFVDAAQGFPEVIERQLNAAGVRAEVLRFGMDGAPLSQYLHMLRREVRAFKPDLVVVQLIHNDFDESYRFLKTRYASAFLKIGVDVSGRPREIAPEEFTPGRADALRQLNTFRYLYYKTGAYLRLKRLVSGLWWGGDEDFAPEFVSSGVDIRRIADHAKNRFFARYVLSEMQALSREDGFKLAFAMDGVREAIYAGKPLDSYEVHKLNVSPAICDRARPVVARPAGHLPATLCPRRSPLRVPIRLALERARQPTGRRGDCRLPARRPTPARRSSRREQCRAARCAEGLRDGPPRSSQKINEWAALTGRMLLDLLIDAGWRRATPCLGVSCAGSTDPC